MKSIKMKIAVFLLVVMSVNVCADDTFSEEQRLLEGKMTAKEYVASINFGSTDRIMKWGTILGIMDELRTVPGKKGDKLYDKGQEICDKIVEGVDKARQKYGPLFAKGDQVLGDMKSEIDAMIRANYANYNNYKKLQ